MLDSNYYERDTLIQILDKTVGKTLGEVDVNKIFEKTIGKPKITGIAGDVIEQSVLGYPPDKAQRPDLDIDGELTELKTTGMKRKKDRDCVYFEAKEPASVTAVSIGTIETESFFESAFWHKIANMLFVFYEYESDKTVEAYKYRYFHIRGYRFYSFKDEDLAIIQHDWQIIHDYLLRIRNHYNTEDAKAEYPNLSTIINKHTVYLDTAPKYPNPPRFRIRKRVITSIIQDTFRGDIFINGGTIKNDSLETLPSQYVSYYDIERKCSVLTQCYRRLSMYQLLSYFEVKAISRNRKVKQYAEQVIVRMFGGTSKKMSHVSLFNRFGIIGKAVTLTKRGGRTEDIKLLPVDFSELERKTCFDEVLGKERDFQFEDSELFNYLSDNKLLCIIFKESPDKSGALSLDNNIFCGFKLLDLSIDEILVSAKSSWEKARQLVLSNSLNSEPVLYKNGAQRFTPKTNIPMESTNLPKAKNSLIFFRGTGDDATDKILVQGIRILRQNYWIKGTFIAKLLEKEHYIYPSNSNKIEKERNHVLAVLRAKGVL